MAREEKEAVCFVQLFRYGDIVLCLPMMLDYFVRGHDVYCVVHRDFAGILDAVSYVTPIVFEGQHRDVAGAVAQAEAVLRHKYGDRPFKVIRTQAPKIQCDMVNGLVTEFHTGRIVEAENFVQRLWLAADMWERFPLPLTFDRRGYYRDQRVLQDHGLGHGTGVFRQQAFPVLVLSLQGYSSYNRHAEELRVALHKQFVGRFIVLDLTYDPVLDRGHKLERVTDLLPLIESADFLIASNSLPLHLAFAFGTPTIALQPDHGPDDLGSDPRYWKAEPMKHWILETTYKRAVTAEGLAEITEVLGRYGPSTPKGIRIPPGVDT